MICGLYSYAKSEMLSNTHTHHTHRPSTVTLAAHARRGLISVELSDAFTDDYNYTVTLAVHVCRGVNIIMEYFHKSVIRA